MTAPPQTLAPGVWGGEQVALQVGVDKAVLKLGCAEGDLPAPIRLDAKGHFSIVGRFMGDTGGPATPDHKSASARFDGVLVGDRLTLTVYHDGTTDTYQLERGLQAKVIRCL